DPGFDNAFNPNGASAETFRYEINWGDGTNADAGVAPVTTRGDRGILTAGGFGGSHIFADNGTYTVRVTMTDDDGGVDTKSFMVTVKNVNPTLSVVPNQVADEGATLNLPRLGTFTDPGFD